MPYASAILVFNSSVNPKVLADTQAKVGCPVQGLSKEEFLAHDFKPAELLLLAPNDSFDPSAEWVSQAAYHAGCKAAGLLFMGCIPIAEIDSALTSKAWADKLYAVYSIESDAEHEAYLKSPKHAEYLRLRAAEIEIDSAKETLSFQAAMQILADAPESADTHPEFYKAVGDWIILSDNRGVRNYDHAAALLDAVLKAGFVNGEGAGNPAAKNKSDLRAYGRYCVGQMLDMGTSSPGTFKGSIHPMLGDCMVELSQNPTLAMAHKLAIKKKSLGSPSSPAASGPKA